jgi:arsenite methyltransferase
MKNYLNFNFDADDFDFVSVCDELPLWSAPFGMILLETIKLKENAIVLDIGCGTGFPLIELAGRFGENSRLYGIDPWKKAVERIRLKLKKYEIKNVQAINCPAEEMPFDNDYFDLIVSNNGINNVQSQEKVLKECNRVCKKNGQFCFTVNLPGTMKKFYDIYEETLRENNLTNEIKKMKEHILEKRKPVDYLEKVLKNSGFEIVNKIEKSFFMKFANGTAMLNYHFIKSHFVNSWKVIVDSSRLEGIFESIENKLNKASKTDGHFSLEIPYICFDCINK